MYFSNAAEAFLMAIDNIGFNGETSRIICHLSPIPALFILLTFCFTLISLTLLVAGSSHRLQERWVQGDSIVFTGLVEIFYISTYKQSFENFQCQRIDILS